MTGLSQHLRDTVPNSTGPDLYDREWERIAAAAEAFVREQVARDIENACESGGKQICLACWNAARIARGGAA